MALFGTAMVLRLKRARVYVHELLITQLDCVQGGGKGASDQSTCARV